MSTLYINTLDKNLRDIFQKLSNFSDEFVLAGGTAIMLLANYRKSFDFDLFSQRPLKKSLLAKARQIFGDDINIQVDNSKLLLFTTPDGVKIDFVHFPYPPLHDVVKNGPISLFDLRDLASNKAYTIGRRATWRDYIDMFFLEKRFGLGLIMDEAKTRFKGEFSKKLFLEQLVYYDDLEILPTKFIGDSYSTEEIQKHFQTVVKGCTKKEIGIS